MWPRVYSVFSERCLTGRDFTQKRWDIHIYDPLIMVMIKSTSMILVNVLVHFNQLLWYFCSFPHIQYRHPPSHLPSQKKNQQFRKHFFFHFICVVVKTKSLMIFPLSCNYNNYMTYNWPNSAFFNFQKNANQENCRHSSCILFFYWQIGTKNLMRREFIVEPSFFTSWTIRSEKCARAHVQQNKTIYLSIYLSIWKPFWKRVCIYIYNSGPR